MKFRYLFLFVLLISSLVSFAQPNNWVSSKLTFANPSFPFSALGQIDVNENTLSFVKRNKILQFSYFGEPIDETIFELEVGSLSILSVIHSLFKRNHNGQDVYVLSIIKPGDRLYIGTYSLDGQALATALELEERANVVGSREETTILEGPNNDLIVFSSTTINTYTLQDDFSWLRSSTLEHNFGDISNAIKVGNNYFITTENGIGALLNAEFGLIWQNNTGHQLENAKKIDDGFILCGTDINTETAFITKLNDNGDQLWQQAFEGKAAYQVLPHNGQYLIGGIDIYSLDSNGDLFWNKQLPNQTGVYDMLADAYDGILLQTKEVGLRVDIDSEKPFQKHNSLAVNNIETHISPVGNIDFDNGAIQYPIGAETSPIFTNAPIFAGLDIDGEFKGFYEPYTEGDGFIGLPQNVAASDNTLWKITQKEIDNIQDKLEADEPLEPYSHSMLTYPGKGNPNCVINGETIVIDNEFAPFVDVNNDGIYNMFDGDYPEMKGDQMIWWAIKDPNSELEIQGRWYAYNCGDHIVSNTVYVDYKLVNRSTDDLFDCRFGQFVDWDLGCHTDDMVGSLPDANAVFVYNADATDGTTDADCGFGINTYNDNIPIQSLTFLNEDLASSMYINNGSNSPEPVPTTDPDRLEEVNHFLHARFRDGTPLTTGGNGYNPTSTDVTQFVFPGNPSNPDEWSMFQEGLGVGDRRSMVATPDFNLSSGESRLFSFAFTTHPDIPHPGPDVNGIELSLFLLNTIFDNGNSFVSLNLGQDLMIGPDESLNLEAGNGALSYEWSTGETTATVSINVPGNYAVTIIDDTGCQRTDDINVNLATTAVFDVNNIGQLNMFPNPISKGQTLTIELAETSHLAAIKVHNLLGQEVYAQSINAFTKKVELRVNNTIDKGIYLIQLASQNGQLMIGKLIVD